ncbi:MAG TPA: SpoIIE family protein phosphatase [Chthoniobacteraceae bacterium]|nr:SpoIIE family protein phosphatase [Chthoniobacteraceae bacterium]
MVQVEPSIQAPDVEEYSGIEFAAEFGRVAAVVAKLLAFCLKQGIAPEVCSQIELATVEAVNNAIEHGCTGVGNARVRLRWSWAGEFLEVRVYDPGKFMPGTATSTELPEDLLAEGGRGGFLMTTLMDSVEHRLADGQHCVVLRKNLGQKPAYRAKDIESAALLRDMTAELSTSYETLAALFHFSQELATAPTFDQFAGSVLTRLIDVLSANEANILVAQEDGRLTLCCARFREETGGDGSGVTGPMTLVPPQDQTIEGKVFQSGVERTVDDCSIIPPSDPLWRAEGVAYVCPLLFQGKVLGVLSVLRLKAVPFFSAGQISLIRTMAESLGIARATMLLQHQRQAEQRAIRELEIAAEIQQSLVPKSFPTNPRARVFGVSQTAFRVGGDYFDALTIGENGMLMAIADVMGKGMPAAILATILRTSVHARLELAETPGLLLTEVSRQLFPDLARLDSFITAQIAFYSHGTGTLLYASAGHCPLLKFPGGKGGPCEELKGGGMPLGVMQNERYETHCVTAFPGDRFVFLTDGIYEAEDTAGKALGWERAIGEIPGLWTGTPAAFCGRMLDVIRKFTGYADASDDRTLLTLECF